MSEDDHSNNRTASRRDLIKWGLGGVGALAFGPTLLSACGGSAGVSKAVTATTTLPDLDPELLAKARKEGVLNLVAVPNGEGSSYLDLLATFKRISGLQIVISNPGGSSAMEIGEVESNKGKPTQPDVVDLGVSFAVIAAKRGIVAPYRPAGWADVPTNWTDVRSNWTCSYYCLTSIVTDTSEIPNAPKTFADLLELPSNGCLGLNGDPRSDASGLGSGAAFSSVWAAALANGGSYDDITPGVEFFGKLKAKGIYNPDNITIPELMAGDVKSNNKPKVGMMLNTEGNRTQVLAKNSKGNGSTFETHVPSDGFFANSYAQSMVANSPHPNAAKLWLDYLLSDAGALAFMRGGAVSTRFAVMHAQGKVPASVLAELPDPRQLAKILPPTQLQSDTAQKLVNAQWESKVLNA